ncbi:MAG TPA: signal peptidase II [Firmicutes bacterium]|nr:signal peptidase II [Bacillota bacterium]
MWLLVAITVITILIDQLTKYLIVTTMTIGQSIPLIDGVLSITSHRNAGAAWGIFQGKMMFFYVVTLIVIGIILYWMNTINIKKEYLLGIALALILGGAIGNFIDRLLFQQVTDFIDVYIFGYDFPIFNVADSALCIGVFLMAVDALKEIFAKNPAAEVKCETIETTDRIQS